MSLPTPKNLKELTTLLKAEVVRAEGYHPPYQGTPFAVLVNNEDYVRGGKDALNGVIKMLEAMQK